MFTCDHLKQVSSVKPGGRSCVPKTSGIHEYGCPKSRTMHIDATCYLLTIPLYNMHMSPEMLELEKDKFWKIREDRVCQVCDKKIEFYKVCLKTLTATCEFCTYDRQNSIRPTKMVNDVIVRVSYNKSFSEIKHKKASKSGVSYTS